MSAMREGQRLPKDGLKPGETWPGQADGLPEPGTPESAEYHRRAWEQERSNPEPAPRNPPKQLDLFGGLENLRAVVLSPRRTSRSTPARPVSLPRGDLST